MQIHNSLKTPSQRNLHLAKLVSFSLFLVFASAIATAQRAAPDLPAQVAIPANLRIPVVLDTPLSSGISKQGQIVTFRTIYSVPLGDGLEVPSGTAILGHIVAVRRAAHFGKEGELRLAVDQIRLNLEDATNLTGHLDAIELKEEQRVIPEKPRSPDASSGEKDSAGEPGLGTVIGEAREAGSGASAGVAVLIMTSPRGQEVFLQQGMRFTVNLDEPVHLSGEAVYAAQQDFLKNRGPSALESNPRKEGLPKLKRRRLAQD